jgi:hypothetical protein
VLLPPYSAWQGGTSTEGCGCNCNPDSGAETCHDSPEAPSCIHLRCPDIWRERVSLRQHAVAENTRQRGWPSPTVYADKDDPSLAGGCSSAIATLTAAVSAGRHDALIISVLDAISGGPAYLLTRLLFLCTDHGVALEFLTPPATPHSPAFPPPAVASSTVRPPSLVPPNDAPSHDGQSCLRRGPCSWFYTCA